MPQGLLGPHKQGTSQANCGYTTPEIHPRALCRSTLALCIGGRKELSLTRKSKQQQGDTRTSLTLDMYPSNSSQFPFI